LKWFKYPAIFLDALKVHIEILKNYNYTFSKMNDISTSFFYEFSLMNRIFCLLMIVLIATSAIAQTGQLSGDLMLNANFFQRDTAINAANTPLYDNFLSSAEGWLTLGYTYNDFNALIRFDLFNNSNLINPQKAFTGQGLGFWQLRKNIKELTITAGSFYEQFGSGIVYRSYEDRFLGIDYATVGIKLDYKISDKWKATAFTGRQKIWFDFYKPIIKGARLEGSVTINDHFNINPGIAALNRTLDASSMNFVVSNLNTYPDSLKFCPKYNVYVGSFYNTTNYKNLSWYIEAAYKSSEATFNEENKLVNKPGSVLYSSLTYSRTGIGLTVQAKRTESFDLRTSPNERLLQGVLNYLPPLTRQNSFRLPARYNAAALALGEMAYQADLFITPYDGFTLTLNYSNVHDLNKRRLYEEYYSELEINKWKKMNIVVGYQLVYYNMEVYRVKPNEPSVIAHTPFIEYTYKITRKKSIRTELQYQNTKQDFGSWVWALVEYNLAPRFSVAVSDMYNIAPNAKNSPGENHYYNIFFAYNRNANRFTLAYVRQVEGVNCMGGVCRFEPAFSGVRFTVATSF